MRNMQNLFLKQVKEKQNLTLMQYISMYVKKKSQETEPWGYKYITHDLRKCHYKNEN
jgi:hypothetical protein